MMIPYSHHIFVCLGKRCKKRGSEDLLDDLKELIKKKGLKEKVRLSRSGCVKTCKETDDEGEYSPVVIVYPEGVWYKNVTREDLEDLLESHIVGGKVLSKRLHFNLGNYKDK